MAKRENQVFVLGAGFTKAFVPGAPLLVDDFGLQTVYDSISADRMPHAKAILRAELAVNTQGRVNLERLMTRLEGRMPYDRKHGAEAELSWLSKEVMRCFQERLQAAQDSQATEASTAQKKGLKKFARYCSAKKINVITFNYDVVLDKTLYSLNAYPHLFGKWNPWNGYGFSCAGSERVVGVLLPFNTPSPMSVLKLHGSLNWRVRMGCPSPYMTDDVVYHYPDGPLQNNFSAEIIGQIAPHLDNTPFIIPPVLLTAAQRKLHPTPP